MSNEAIITGVLVGAGIALYLHSRTLREIDVSRLPERIEPRNVGEQLTSIQITELPASIDGGNFGPYGVD